MRTVPKTLAALALLGLAAGGATVGFGLYNVSARVGHLPGVSWVLHTTFRQSVELRAPPASAVPDIADPDLIELGAKHFKTACAFCHASPGELRHATARSMVPEPPHITDAVADWQPRHLFWIVKEGVKMSGMPNWPATRKDEVWAVVAYLQSIRQGGEAVRIADSEGGYCATCHGRAGRSGNGHIPRLDILGETYMTGALMAYRSGERESGFMQHAATRVSDEALRESIARYAAAEPAGPAIQADPALAEAGARLARAGTEDVPACTACHGPEATRGSPSIPALAGQYRPYLETQLTLWRDGARGGGERANLMRKAAQDLSDADIEALAAWYASLDPRRASAE